MSDLIEKVAKAICDVEGDFTVAEFHRIDAQAAIAVVLKDMHSGRCLSLSGEDFTDRWRQAIENYAMREGIDLTEIL